MTVVLNELFWIWQFVEGLSDAVLKLFEQLFVPDFLLQTTTHCSSDLRQSSSSQCDHWLQTWLVSCLQTLLPHTIIFASESRDEKIECWGGGGRWSQTESIWRWCGGGGVAIERGILYFYFCLAQCSLKISKIVCEVLALIQSRYFGNIKLELIESK